MTSPPRIAPGSREELGTVNAAITAFLGAAAGTNPPNLFTTLGRHRGLFRPWLRFASRLMPGGRLPRVDSELVILRVSHNCDCAYEHDHHVRLGQAAGLSRDEVERVAQGPDAPGWTGRQAALLRATDELHRTRTLSDEAWAPLAAELSEPELIELCLLVGHYEMLAMTLNALRVELDRPSADRAGIGARAIRALARARGMG